MELETEEERSYSELVTGTRSDTPSEPGIESGKPTTARNLRGRLTTRLDERWIAFPREPTIIFPIEAFTPKVQVEQKEGRKCPICSIEMKRRRRLYRSLKLEELLIENGIRMTDVLPMNHLPLEIFDDEEYDCRTPEEWLKLGMVDGQQHPVPAEALIKSENSYKWCPCGVVGYDSDKRLWELRALDGTKQNVRLSRIFIRFYAEDPRVFVERISEAIKQRNLAENNIRYNLYIDSVNYEGLETLSNRELERIHQLSMWKTIDREREAIENRITTVTQEIKRNYQRAMCDLECRRLLRDHPVVSACLAGLANAPGDTGLVKPSPVLSKSRKISFQKTKDFVQWNSLYVHPEVYEAMIVIAEKCRRVSNMELFFLKQGKTLTLPDFEETLLHSTHVVINYLRDRWVNDISQTIRMRLRDIGKGWFDLNQKNYDIYDVMKLKRFMILVKQRMQSALRTMVENSSLMYLKILEAPYFGVPNSEDELDLKPAKYSVFLVEISLGTEGAFYKTNLESFEEKLENLYVNAMQLCQLIKQIQPTLMTNLKFAKNLYLSSVDLNEKNVSQTRQRIKAAYRRSIVPLMAYRRKFDKYLPLHNLNIDKYIENYESEEFTALELKEEILSQYTAKANLEAELPKRIRIGMFDVILEELRNKLIDKQLLIAHRLLEMQTRRLGSEIIRLLEECQIIYHRIVTEPTTIEQLVDTRDWMELLPATISGHREILQKLKMEYDMLDSFRWNLSDDDFHDKWQAFYFPTKIQNKIEETRSVFATLEKEQFYQLHLEDEATISDKIDGLIAVAKNIMIQNNVNKVQEIAAEIKKVWKMMTETQEFGVLLNSRQKLFGVKLISYERLAKLIKEFDPYKSFWLTTNDWLSWHQIWMTQPLITIDGTNIDGMVTEMYKTMMRCIKIFQQQPEILEIANNIRNEMDDFKPYIGVIEALRNPGMKPRHFQDLSTLIEIKISLTPDITFKYLLSLDLMKHQETIREISESAAKEFAIEMSLNKMTSEWETLEMEVTPYKDTGTFIMKISEDIQLLLDDHVIVTQQLSFNPYKAAFEKEIDEWSDTLKLIQEVVGLWIDVQKSWLYLEPIFSSEAISVQLPVESKKYRSMDRNWRRIMKLASENPLIIKFCPDKILLESLRECMSLLEVAHKGLAEYLESRRMIFPRLFFLGDEELLELLAEARNPRAVQPHLCKCFEGIKSVNFEHDLSITWMYSAEGEEVKLAVVFKPVGSAEVWLGQLEDSMRETLRLKIKESLETVEVLSRKEWVLKWPGQISLCVGQTSWTAHMEYAILQNDLKGYRDIMMTQLDDLRHLVRGEQTQIERMMVEAIITIEVHARDVLQTLIEGGVSSVNDFDWISQLRYYWLEDSRLVIRAVNAEFSYGYEYLGNSGRLVITPLTDRCYLTLTGALHLKFGGAPAGPAGTGKTETTKDLGKAFAIQCVVFNCSDQLDFMSMGKFFKGLASSGAWACFDEFNRIDIEVLSVIAQQIMTIQKAQQLGSDRFMFEGVELSLRASCAVFITMNPGYAGRTELPDNLKALFRPVAMMVPNYALIAEISLFSYGFVEAKALSAKITATFKLSSEQLSTQDHYDFGMRSVKAAIAAAGNLKRLQKDMNEQQICLRALRDVNVPKFLKDDLILFNGIVSDLFPNTQEKLIDYGILVDSIQTTIQDMGLAGVKDFVGKVLQLYETTTVRHGLMLVGPTGSGKTTCYKVLQAACTRLKGKPPFTRVHTYILNPKSITMGQLYGEYDTSTHEWFDGILPTLIRIGTSAKDHDKRWYIFDGPVDAVWIENMNTVLDDNKKLCLTSGEIIRLTPYQTMMFEVADLRVASPATVSRCGMVYLEPQGLGLNPFIDCWVARLPFPASYYAAEVSKLAYLFLPSSLRFLRKNLVEIVPSVDSGLVRAYTNLMDYQIRTNKSNDEKEFPAKLLEAWSAYALIWSIGATCDSHSRYLFSEWVRDIQKKANHLMPFPPEGLVYDYRLQCDDINEVGEENAPRWVKWLDSVSDIIINPDVKFSDIEVPTIDTARSYSLIDWLLTSGLDVLCIGPTASGKTSTITGKLSRDMPKGYICEFIIFSARTSAARTQGIKWILKQVEILFYHSKELIDAKLDRRRGGVYGPTTARKQIFFVDDLNMPALEVYGAQPPIELLRQLLDSGGWYDRKEIGTFKTIVDVNIISAMAPPGGGRNPVTARFLRHFHYIAFPEMEDDTKRTIFGQILFSWLSRTPGLEDMLDPLFTASLKIFSTICKELLPTPSKSHYTFNVRDLGRVYQGMLIADPSHIYEVDDLLQLWYHENCRVFCDRLTNEVDRRWFKKLLRENMIEYFNYEMELGFFEGNLYFGDFANSDGRYQRIYSVHAMERAMLEFLDDYNSSTTIPMNLVFFEDAMSHICRITRILRQSPGNALLLGMGGSGRQSLTKLSAYIAEYNCFQIELSKSYSIRDWRDDIKELLLNTGLQRMSTVFLFSDTQIKSGLFLEDINNILNSGDVPNIYQPDELDRIYQAMRGPVQEAGLPVNKSNLFSAYQKVVRNNLHTVLTMCPVGETFRARIRQFPALVNLCTIDWFDPWPDSALQSVAMHFLQNITNEAVTETVLKSIVETCQFMHSNVVKASDDYLQELSRHVYVTPTSYLELISSYGDLLDKKKNELTLRISRLTTGLNRLASTEVEVKEMQVLLEKMKPELELAAKNAAVMMEHIAQDTQEAEKARVKAEEQEREATKLKLENQAIRDEAEADLSTARPMLEAAEQSLKALNKGDITEVKAMKRPPVGVILVIEAICIVKKVKPKKIAGEMPGQKLNDYWTPGSQMLADAGQFLASLEKYNKDELTEEIIQKLKTYVENPNFQPKKVLQVSKACHSLCLWVHAMYNWYFVNQRVAPKMAALQEAEEALVKTELTLAVAMAKLKEVEDGLANLEQLFRTEEEKKQELEAQKKLCEERMSRAVRLITGLLGERKRWISTVQQDTLALGNLIGDVLLSAGAVAYLTPFVPSYRSSLLSSWQRKLSDAGVAHTPGRGPVEVLGSAVLIRSWQLDGLPRDSTSVESAVLVSSSRRWPLFIDPQGQAVRWIRNMGKSSGLSTVRMTDKDLLRVIEGCVRFGRACLIENIGLELEPSLDTVLMRSLLKQGGQPSIRIGDNVVPYNSDFRLYLATKLPNPHYAPEIAVKVLLVNFALTASGLEDQMLSLVVMQERPELEESRSALILSSAQMKRELEEIEERILQRLSLSVGSAVDDIDLILTLEASKVKSEEIKQKVEYAEITQVNIDVTRSLYVPVATRAQILFFCLLDLQQVDSMYQYSLEWFTRIFINSIASAENDEDIAVRVTNINEHFTFALFTNVCRSLFEKHKLHFAFLLCARIQMAAGLIDRHEWRFLLSGAISPKDEPNPAPNWLPERCWTEMQSLQVLQRFKNFPATFKSISNDFKRIFDSRQPEIAKYPEPWESFLDEFAKLLVLKCLRADRLAGAMQTYVAKNLGSRFIEPQPPNLTSMYNESSSIAPLIFVLSSGTDPAFELYKFAEKMKAAARLRAVSLGQGQGPKAELMLKKALETGEWLFFQNCHLAPSWMPKLELLLEALNPDNTHGDFRLWLTSMPSNAFPVSILQNGCKMTMEPPRGVKANVLRTYTTQVVEMQEFMESEHPKAITFKSMLFSLCLFHAVLLERRKYGPLGFNIPYEFTDGDFTICMSQLRMFLMEYIDTPFKVLIYTAGHINYGGRITDDWDRRCVITILQDFYNDRVLNEGHQFDAQGHYRQPSHESKFAEYLEYIKTFPINDDPSLFGLHTNADISYARAEAYACLATLLALEPREIGSAVQGADEVTGRLAESILNVLPEPFDLDEIQKKYPVSYNESLNTVLLQEAVRYNVLIREMSSSLKDLLRALKGLAVMSEKLEAMTNSMGVNQVPENWQNKGFASLKPLGAWVEDFRKRIAFIRSWCDEGIPASFWISGLYFPQALLTAALQNYARKYSIPVDTLDFNFTVLSEKPRSRPENGCVVYGLYLEGCRWDGITLTESLSKELFTDMPPILLVPEANRVKPDHGFYECPVYKTVVRAGTLSTTGHSTNFVLAMEIPSRKPPAHWVIRGVALICSLDF